MIKVQEGMVDANPEELLTIDEFRGPLKVTKACIRRWILEGKLKKIKLGRLVRLKRSELDRILKGGI
jgi:excisionase family DNA binding protein